MAYLTPKMIAQLGNLQVVARMVVQGVLTGHHKSPAYGFNIEFAEHRPYMPGDEPRHVDWKYFAKTDSYFVKQFEESTSLRGMILLDRSASMRFGKGPLSKLEYSRYLAAALAHLMLQQHDSVGIGTFAKGLEDWVEPSRSGRHLHRLLETISASPEEDETDFSKVLEAVATRLKRRHLILVISDFLSDPEETLRGLRALAARKHEIVLFHVLSQEELDFPYDGVVRFEDLEETGANLSVDTSTMRGLYLEEMQNFLQTLGQGAGSLQIGHEIFRTDQALEEGLGRVLAARQRRGA